MVENLYDSSKLLLVFLSLVVIILPLASSSEIQNFTVSINYSIDSPSEDSIVLDGDLNPSEGSYTSDELSLGYIASQSNEVLSGLVASRDYNEINFLNLTETYNFRINQETEDSFILFPFTSGKYEDIESRWSEIRSGGLFDYVNPSISYPLDEEKNVRIILNYENIILNCFAGSIFPGTHSLTVRKTGLENGKPEIEVRR